MRGYAAGHEGSVSGAALTTLTVVVLLETGDKLSDTKVLDHSLEHLVVAGIDLLDLDLGTLGDKVHLALSFLL